MEVDLTGTPTASPPSQPAQADRSQPTTTTAGFPPPAAQPRANRHDVPATARLPTNISQIAATQAQQSTAIAMLQRLATCQVSQAHASQAVNARRELIAHNISVLGHMWTFRRWYLARHYSIEDYIHLQTTFILSMATGESEIVEE